MSAVRERLLNLIAHSLTPGFEGVLQANFGASLHSVSADSQVADFFFNSVSWFCKKFRSFSCGEPNVQVL